MLRGRIIFIFILLVSLSIKAEISDPTGVFNEGNKQYEEHNYEAAINSYKGLSEEFFSPELFLNLGNSYYKLDDIPNTIIYYEKALKIEPDNQTALFHKFKVEAELENSKKESLVKKFKHITSPKANDINEIHDILSDINEETGFYEKYKYFILFSFFIYNKKRFK